MILDTLTNAKRYDMSPRFQQAFAFLATITGRETLGRHEIDGEDVFALVQKYDNKLIEDAQFEAHRKYVDVQYVHAGRESILWAPLAAMKQVLQPYNESKDSAKYALVPELTHLHLAGGYVAILYPEDAHAPGMIWDLPGEVVKVVVKIRTDDAPTIPA